jgi:hypothetical protein
MNIPKDYFDIADKLHQITDTIPININDILEEFDDIKVQYVNKLNEPLVIKHDGGYLFKTVEHPSWKQSFVIAKHLAHLLLGHVDKYNNLYHRQANEIQLPACRLAACILMPKADFIQYIQDSNGLLGYVNIESVAFHYGVPSTLVNGYGKELGLFK